MASHAAPPASTPTTATPTAPMRPAHWTDYLKVLAHIAAGMLALVLAAATDGLSAVESLQLGAYFVGSVFVYAAENTGSGPWNYTKAICAWLTVALTASLPFAVGGWSALLDSAPAVAAAVIGALGVGILPNTGTTSLADAVRTLLGEVQQLRSQTPAASGQFAWSSSSGGAVTPAVQVRGAHAPATTAGGRPAASPVDTGTMEAVRARSGDGFLS